MSATLNIDLFIDYFDNCPAITGNDKTQSVNGILQKCTLNSTNLFARDEKFAHQTILLRNEIAEIQATLSNFFV